MTNMIIVLIALIIDGPAHTWDCFTPNYGNKIDLEHSKPVVGLLCH